MVLPVDLNAVIDGMHMVGDEITAYVNRKTGDLTTVSEEELSHAENEGYSLDIPEWQQEIVEEARKVLADDNWIELPDRFDIHEYSIMERFCYSIDDERMQDSLLRAISGKGAFRRFKDRVAELGVRDDWFAFRDAAFKKIAVDFLESRQIAFIDE